MRTLLVIALCASSAAAAPSLTPIASSDASLDLIQGRGRVAIVKGAGGWYTAGDAGLVNDKDTAASLAAHEKKLVRDVAYVFWGRTPGVAADDKKKPRIARAGGKAAVKAPGVVERVVALDDTRELWRYATGTGRALAIVDAKDRVKKLPDQPMLGQKVGGAVPGVCAKPLPWRVAEAQEGAAVLLVECHRDTPRRLLTVRPDGKTAVRTLASSTLDEDNQFAVQPDGKLVIAGVVKARLAIAREGADGAFTVTPTSIPNIEVQEVRLSDGAVWTLSVGETGWIVAKDGAALELASPTGEKLVPSQLGYDAKLGVVVLAGKSGEVTRWVFAERGAGTPATL